MREFKELWSNKYDPQGKINITVFFTNIFLIMCHVFLMVMYCIIGHRFMIGVNVLSLFVYIFYTFQCYKNIERYMGVVFLEMWLHQICAILSFGWTPCFQNWSFGMIAAYFLPAFSNENQGKFKRPFFFAFLIIITYFMLATIPPLMDISITVDLGIYMNSVLFFANNLIVFISITLFCLFYTNRHNRKEMELSRKADYDELTELYNRHAINELSKRIIQEAKDNKSSYNVAILDVDFFKKINDQYGHNSGDLVLKKVALILKAAILNKMIVGRWGGEEFVIISSGEIQYKKFTDMLENLRLRISKTIFKCERDENIGITISIGAANVKKDVDFNSAIKVADERLYKAKESGRNKLIKK
jgi:diguanylate cyclase (GGDEF)-like protein